MVDYLRQLDSLGRILPPLGESPLADVIVDMMGMKGEEGPPGVYAIVSKKMVENGGQMMVGEDVLLWDENIGGAVDLDTRFTCDDQDDTVILWDEDDGWVQLADDEDDE